MRLDFWGADDANKLFNWKELGNFMELVEEEAAADMLHGKDLFLFTGSMVAEGIFFRGTSSSWRLFDLVVCLQEAEISCSFHLHVVNMAGMRMIDQGTDGLSRTNFLEGALKGNLVLEYVPLHQSVFLNIPLHQSAVECSPVVVD